MNTIENINDKIRTKSFKRYILMCFQSKKYLNYEICEGDQIFCYMDQTETIKILSSRVVAVQYPAKHLTVAVPVQVAKAQFSTDPTDPYASLDEFCSNIDFNILPKEYWFKVYRMDQLMDLLGIDSINTLGSWLKEATTQKYMFFDSIESTMLASIMKYRFDLTWIDSKHEFIKI